MIERAVVSALDQCREGDEVIVVDDGSTDNTADVLQPYRDRIRYIRAENAGAGAARNRGVREARNELVAFLDSDDEWMPGKIDLQRSLLEKRDDILYVFSDFAVKDECGREVRRYLKYWHEDKRSWDEIVAPGVPYSQLAPLPKDHDDFAVHAGDMYYLLAANLYVCTITVMVRREEAAEALWFTEDLPLYEDWACFGRLARRGRGAYLDCETAWNHGHRDDRLTQSSALQCVHARLLILDEVWGSNPEFIAEHGDYYQEILNQQRVVKAAGLISAGEHRRARMELGRVDNPPLTHVVLAALPPFLTRAILAVRRLAMRLVQRDGVPG
jgi:glycosyltransferase involved in cell wall biosynthesis